MAQSCVYCGNQVVWADVMATREGMRVADIADSKGLLALEERQQYIHMGMVCGPCCGPTVVRCRSTFVCASEW